MGKRGQIQGQIVLILLSAIVVIGVLYFGWSGIQDMRERKLTTQGLEFEASLRSSIAAISSNVGSIKTEEITVPSNIDQVCFFDLTKVGYYGESRFLSNFPEILVALSSGSNENVFMIKDDKVVASYAIEGAIYDTFPYYYCYDVERDKISVYLEGRGGTAKIARTIEACEVVENNAAEEQTFSSGDGGIVVNIPAGTGTNIGREAVCVSPTSSKNVKQPEGQLTLLDEAYELEPEGATFDQDIEVRLYYGPYVDESQLIVVYMHNNLEHTCVPAGPPGGDGISEPDLFTCSMNAGENYISIFVDSFSEVILSKSRSELPCEDEDGDGVIDIRDRCPKTEVFPKKHLDGCRSDPAPGVSDDGCSCDDLDADDQNPCTDDFCDGGEITHVYNNIELDSMRVCPPETCVGDSLLWYVGGGKDYCEDGRFRHVECIPIYNYSASCDMDDDDDCYPDAVEVEMNTSPNNASSFPSGIDRDCVADFNDLDNDNDNYTDENENIAGSRPDDALSRPADFDKDYIPDAVDDDDDNDGWLDTNESPADGKCARLEQCKPGLECVTDPEQKEFRCCPPAECWSGGACVQAGTKIGTKMCGRYGNWEEKTCEETDNGMDQYSSGQVFAGKTYEDRCLDDYTLLEYYCLNGWWEDDEIHCARGCIRGACVPPPPVSAAN